MLFPGSSGLLLEPQRRGGKAGKQSKTVLPHMSKCFIEQILRVKYYTTRKVELIRPSPSPLGAYSLAGETDILQEINEVKTFRNKPQIVIRAIKEAESFGGVNRAGPS